MRVVVLGKGLMLANTILGVKDAGADIVGVFRYENTCHSRLKLLLKDFFMPAPEVTLIKELKLNQIRMKSANSEFFQKLMVYLNVDMIIVGTWKEKLSPQTYNIPKIATVNLHPSLLPKYRGPNPYMQTILHDEKFSGLTIHLVDNSYDNGAILKQTKIPIFKTDTSKELRERTLREVRPLVCELLNDLNERILTPVKQDERQASYFPQISGDERMLDFTVQTSEEISRTIRALHPFLPCYITHENTFIVTDPYNFQILDINYKNKKPGDIVYKNVNNNSMTIICADNKAIKFSKLKLYKSNPIKEFFK